jgi:hypothetical protein
MPVNEPPGTRLAADDGHASIEATALVKVEEAADSQTLQEHVRIGAGDRLRAAHAAG